MLASVEGVQKNAAQPLKVVWKKIFQRTSWMKASSPKALAFQNKSDV